VPENPDQVMTLQHVAEVLSISLVKARRLLNKGLAHFAVGDKSGDVRVLAGDLVGYMRHSRRGGMHQPAAYRVPGFDRELKAIQSAQNPPGVRRGRRGPPAGLPAERGRTGS
jgi:hypothetical protein